MSFATKNVNGVVVASYEDASSGVSASLADTVQYWYDENYAPIEGLSGSRQDDLLIGDTRNNILEGADGSDALEGGAGADSLNGGDGNDFDSYAHSAVGVTASLANPSANKGDAEGDSYESIEGLIGSDGNDLLIGDENDNTLQGGAGNDTLVAGSGADSLDGGDGFDVVSYAGAGSSVTASLAANSDNAGEAAGDTYTSIEALIGSPQDDLLIGDGNDNTLEGGAGNDMLQGGGGNDVVSYANATSSVTASLADHSGTGGEAEVDSYTDIEGLIGSANADLLIGDGNDNTLQGGAGDDTLEGGAGNDSLDGGAAIDFVSYAHSADGVTASLATHLGTGGDAAGDSYASIEGLIGSDGNDLLIGNDDANTLQGGAGHDTLEGGKGADSLEGDGFDFASYANAEGPVTALLMSGSSTSNTGEAKGDDYSGITGLIGSSGDDNLSTAIGSTTLMGGGGNDTLSASMDNVLLEGGAGNDFIENASVTNAVAVWASYANAAGGVTASLANTRDNSGDAAGDTYWNIYRLLGSAHNDRLIGSTTNDTLEGGAGSDSLVGGGGNDTASYRYATSGITASLADTSQNTGDAKGDTYTNINGLLGSSYDDKLIGTSARETLEGGAGNDMLEGGGGGDFYWGEGSDIISYEHASKGVTASLLPTPGQLVSNQNGGGAAGDIYNGYFSGLTGSKYADKLVGGSLPANLDGGAGDDTLESGAVGTTLKGGEGNDFASYANATTAISTSLTETNIYTSIEGLIGSAQDDQLTGDANNNTLEGGAGSDRLKGDNGTDFASYTLATSGVTASLANQRNNTGDDAAGDTFESIEGLIGSAHGDRLIGDEGDNALEGGAGHDTLEGGGGNDFASYAQAASGVTASLANENNNTGDDAVGDTFESIEGLIGSVSADLLIGDQDDNNLQGGAGDDTLEGGDGNDILQGGSGNDFASYANATGPVTASLATPSDNTSEAQGDSYSSIEGLIGAGHDDHLTGDEHDNTLEGGAGADILDGGDGFDFASYASAENGVTVGLYTQEYNSGDAKGDTRDHIEGLIGSAQDDLLMGDTQINSLRGGDGNDDLRGYSGNDTFEGGAGDDTIEASEGDDTVIWHTGDGNDTITLSDGSNTLYLAGWSDDTGSPITEGNTYGAWSIAMADTNATFTRIDQTATVTVTDWTLGTNSVICILPGTLITTPDGHRPIETLTPGDIVTTPEGPRPIRWVGRSRYSMVFLRGKPMCLPVRIHAGALGKGLPLRDLWVSPWHAVLFGKTLVRAFDLINGHNITQDYQGEVASFYNIELDSPDIIFAEGTPVETYANHNNRAMFHNLDEYLALYGSHEPSWMAADGIGIRRHPLLDENAPELAPIRQAVLARAINAAA